MESLRPRILSGILDENIKKTVAEDLVIHRNDKIHDTAIPTPTGHDYQVTCPNFKAISKDRDYVIRCLIQPDSELRHGSTSWLPDLQPTRRKHEKQDLIGYISQQGRC